MGLIPDITCRRCGAKYSGIKSRCPQCGAPRTSQPSRTARTSSSVVEGTAAYVRTAINGRWQLVFGVLLAFAVVLATVVLIVSGGSDVPTSSGFGGSGNKKPKPESNPGAVTISDTYLPSPSPSPVPTPESEAAPAITSMELIFLTQTVSDITVTNPGELVLQFEARVYPLNDSVTIEWRVDNEKVMNVDQTGKVTITGADPNGMVHATVFATCENLEASCIIYVPYMQAAYLTTNTYTGQGLTSEVPEYATGGTTEQ